MSRIACRARPAGSADESACWLLARSREREPLARDIFACLEPLAMDDDGATLQAISHLAT